MTSFVISSHLDRPIPKSWSPLNEDCPFCQILTGELPAYKIYENEYVLAFLDILPLRPGHTLVVPKAHVKYLSDLPDELAGEMGKAVRRIANALINSGVARRETGLNVVCNQEYAQAVPHVHYHIIPAPSFTDSSTRSAPTLFPTRATMHNLEFEARSELDEDEGKIIVEKVKGKL